MKALLGQTSPCKKRIRSGGTIKDFTRHREGKRSSAIVKIQLPPQNPPPLPLLKLLEIALCFFSPFLINSFLEAFLYCSSYHFTKFVFKSPFFATYFGFKIHSLETPRYSFTQYDHEYSVHLYFFFIFKNKTILYNKLLYLFFFRFTTRDVSPVNDAPVPWTLSWSQQVQVSGHG